MENNIIPIRFSGRGIEYHGWVMPSSEQHEDGHPKHYRVVLNNVFFGKIRLNRGKWFGDEPLMQELAVAVGDCLERVPGRHRPPAF